MRRLASIEEKGIYVAPDADAMGDIAIGENSSIWYHAVIRNEHASVTIGKRSNIQDGCVIHTDPNFPVVIGDDVTVGHRAIVHGCTIGDGTLIGMGSIILNGAVIGKHCLIGAGALVTQGTEIPDGCMAFGSPARVVRRLTEEEIEWNYISAKEYVRLGKLYFGE